MAINSRRTGTRHKSNQHLQKPKYQERHGEISSVSFMQSPIQHIRRLFHKFLIALYYRRVRIIQSEFLPAGGPVLYLGLHRNGAVDGFVYGTRLPRATFMISAQLRRSLLGRLFFYGIEVVRAKDLQKGFKADNRAAVAHCVQHLSNNGELFVMPEGTSDLGFRHLPFQKGAARILQASLASGITPTVIPLGLHYQKAWAWQSDVEIVVGAPISTSLPDNIGEAEAVRILQERITAALESVGINAPDALTFERWQRLAYAATLGTKRSYFAALKQMEQGRPKVESEMRKLETSDWWPALCLYQGVPLMPIRHAWLYIVYACVLLPLVSLAILLNLPVLLAAGWAGRKMADDLNTIALWRILVGAPIGLFWSVGLLAAALAAELGELWLLYAAISWAGIRSLRRLKKLLVSLCNLMRSGSHRETLLTWHQQVDKAMSDRGI